MSVSLHKQWTSTKIVLIYLLFGCSWVMLSDRILAVLVSDRDAFNALQTYKGWFFVSMTSGLLYLLIQQGIKKARRIEAEKQMAGKRYDNLVENAEDFIFTLDENGNFTSSNRAGEKYTGYARAEILKLNLADLLAPESAGCLEYLLHRKPQGVDSVREIKIIRRHGRQVYWEVSSSLLDEKDKRRVIEGIARDVTQRRLMQDALQESELRYKRLIETANEAIWMVDADFRLTLVNSKMCEITGYRADEIIGRSLLDFVDEELKAAGEEYMRQQKKGIRDQSDFRLTRRDGKQVWLIVSSNPLGGDGEFQGVLYMATDITERKLAEMRLRESEDRFRVLFEQSAMGGLIIDERGRVIDCNEVGAELLGYTKEEMKNLAVSDFDADLPAEETLQIPEKARGSQRLQFEKRYRTKTGEVRNVIFVSTGLQIEGKHCRYASFLDITDKKRAEEALRREKERMEKTALASPSVIHSFRLSSSGVPSFPYASPAIYGIYGKSPAELETDASAVFEMIHPEDLRHLVASNRKSAETMSLWYDLWRVDNPQKGEVWVECFSHPVREPDGSITWHGVLNDVTTRERKERELAERQQMITAINNAAPSLIMLWDVREGRVLYVNETVNQIWGCAPDEVYAKSSAEVFADIHPDDLDAVMEFGKKLRRSADNTVLSQEFRYRCGEGSWRVLRSQETVFARDEAGKVIKTLSVINDITDRVSAVKALGKSEERLQKLYRIVSNSESNHAARIDQLLSLGVQEFGVENGLLAEISGEVYSVRQAVSLDDSIAAGFSCELRRTYCGETLRRDDLLSITNVGGSEWSEHPAYEFFGVELYFGVPIKNAGKPYGTLCFASRTARVEPFSSGDCEFLKLMAQWISAELTRQTAEEALRKSEEELLLSQKLESIGRLAGGIAHDFNNMLTAINGYSDLILRQVGETSPLRRSVEEIKKAGERSALLTQQLLAFSRKQILKPEILSINRAVDDTTNLLERLIGEDIALIKILGYDVAQIKVDPGQLSQVVVNLAVNARDAMPHGGKLTIETKNVVLGEDFIRGNPGALAGRYVMLAIADTGVGMNEETLQHLFEPFFTTKEVGKGTGLGLATVYGVIKQSDGYITVDSAPGVGTTFRIYLPAIAASAEADVEADADDEAGRGAETILLVEDETMVRALASEILQSCGYNVFEAENGREALEVCEKNRLDVDLLLTDVVMPQMNGRELWEKLSARQPRMKVLFTSGYTDDTIVRNGVKNDETNFLQKPFSLDALARKVREVLDAETERN